jgi:hypothetical protein
MTNLNYLFKITKLKNYQLYEKILIYNRMRISESTWKKSNNNHRSEKNGYNLI